MKQTILATAVLLTLGACSTGTTTTNGGFSNPTQSTENQVPVDLPDTQTQTDTTNTQIPTDTTNTQTPPDITNTQTQADTTNTQNPTNTGGAFNIQQVLNGTSENDFQNFWRCMDVGETDPDAFFSMRFYSDAHGEYGGGGSIIGFSWAATGNTINMTFPNDNRNLAFANITLTGNGKLNTNFEVTNSPTDALECTLLDLNGNPVFP